MSDSHIFITGTGRAGTTLLVQLLDELGFETSIGQADYYADANAGYETSLLAPDAPYVVKNPKEASWLGQWLADGTVRPDSLDCVIVAVRDLDQATQSRIEQSTAAGRVQTPGGMTASWRPSREREILAERLSDLLVAMAEHNLPHLLVAFPKFALDVDYCFEALGPVLPDVDRSSFDAAWKRTVDPDKVHRYDDHPSTSHAVRLMVSDVWGRALGKVRRLAQRTGARDAPPT